MPKIDISVDVNGKTYHGSYEVIHHAASVEVYHSNLGRRSTQIGGSPPIVTAKLLLRAMIREALDAGDNP